MLSSLWEQEICPVSITLSLRNIFSDRLGDQVLFDEPLKNHVAYRVGGPADILVFPQTEEDLIWLGEISKSQNLPITVIGTGTNLLVKDQGIRGITLSLESAFKEIEVTEKTPSGVLARVGGGVTKPGFLKWAISQGLTGLEFSSGVPGTIGGGIFMNAGTKYGSYGDILKELRLFDFSKGPYTVSKDQFHFGYREQTAVKDRLVVWASFELRKGDTKAIQIEVDRIIEERALKQPLDFPSCGSTFKNPPGFSAGRLIEKAGLKGLSRGGAQISEKHANFILNKDQASAQDILDLIQIAKDAVKKQFGVTLECEVIILGS